MRLLLALFSVLILLGELATGQECEPCRPNRKRRDSQTSPSGNVTVKRGDMWLTPMQVAQMEGKFRASDQGPQGLWPGGKIRYFVGSLPPQGQSVIRNALRDLSAATGGCVSFEEVRSPPAEGVVVSHEEGGCSSGVGRQPGWQPQKLYLQEMCWSAHTVQHEFMHALGFHHEHARPDRDAHIRFDWNNMIGCEEFERCRGCSTLGFPYDKKSVMHYGSVQATCNSERGWGMSNLDGSEIPETEALTQMDIEKIKKLYKCAGGGAAGGGSPSWGAGGSGSRGAGGSGSTSRGAGGTSSTSWGDGGISSTNWDDGRSDVSTSWGDQGSDSMYWGTGGGHGGSGPRGQYGGGWEDNQWG